MHNPSVEFAKRMSSVPIGSAQQGAVAHLRNVHHPSELLVPPVPVQNQVAQCLDVQTLWEKAEFPQDERGFNSFENPWSLKPKLLIFSPHVHTYLSQRGHRACQASPLRCGWCPSAAASPVLLPAHMKRDAPTVCFVPLKKVIEHNMQHKNVHQNDYLSSLLPWCVSQIASIL